MCQKKFLVFDRGLDTPGNKKYFGLKSNGSKAEQESESI
jgi:hypothetical protein